MSLNDIGRLAVCAPTRCRAGNEQQRRVVSGSCENPHSDETCFIWVLGRRRMINGANHRGLHESSGSDYLAAAHHSSAMPEPTKTSPSGLPIEPVYRPDRRADRLRARSRRPGTVPVHARRAADDVSRPPVDDAPVRRLRHRRGDQPALSPSARRRSNRPERRVRPADADGHRLRLAARAWRGRSRRRGDRYASRTCTCCSTRFRSTRCRRR